MMIFWFLSAVAVSISKLEISCDPTYMTSSATSTVPVALSVMSWMNQNCDAPVDPHGFGLHGARRVDVRADVDAQVLAQHVEQRQEDRQLGDERQAGGERD